jgi:hypothetical protein
MHRTLLACAALIAGCGSAAAQVVIETPPADVYVAAPPAYAYETYSYRSGPRVYYEAPRYRYRDIDDDDVVIVRPRYRSGCGAHAYWDGGRCVYFRY